MLTGHLEGDSYHLEPGDLGLLLSSSKPFSVFICKTENNKKPALKT